MSNTDTSTTSQTAAVAERGAHAASKQATATKGTSLRKGAPKAKKTTKKASVKKPAKAAVPHVFTKKAIVIDMLKAKAGASLDEIVQATGWLRHTCRGFLSISGKIYNVTSEKTDAGRRYRIPEK